MPSDQRHSRDSHEAPENAEYFLGVARYLEEHDRPRAAASVYDRAYGLAPNDREIIEARQALLERLTVVEHGLCFRYIPSGLFLMGSEAGDPDEAPVHEVMLGDYWLSDTPVSWAAYNALMGWGPPPQGQPAVGEAQEEDSKSAHFMYFQANKIRLQYCEDATIRARDWHAHVPEHTWSNRGENVSSRKIFGEPARDDRDRPWGYDLKPMVAVAWQDAEALCTRLSTSTVVYRLPTEAEWEKAARGGRNGCPYPWGTEPPDLTRCDFDRFDHFSIQPSRRFPPNGYGLYAMSGGVWEWTADWYDAESYRESPTDDPRGPASGSERVLRGGSWTDCADAVTVSFRMSRGSRSWKEGEWGEHLAPNIGFRLCRIEVAPERPIADGGRVVTSSSTPASPR